MISFSHALFRLRFQRCATANVLSDFPLCRHMSALPKGRRGVKDSAVRFQWVMRRNVSSNRSLSARYIAALHSAPLTVKSISTASLCGIGDVIAQLFINRPAMEKKRKQAIADNADSETYQWQFDLRRLCNMAFVGLVLVGPTLHCWYGFLGKILPGNTNIVAVKRVILDQLLFAPSFVCAFFAALMTVEGRPGDIVAKIRADAISSTIANWILWVPAMFINFRFVPPHLTVLFSNAVAVVWNTYLSYVGNREDLEDEVAHEN